MQMNSAKIIIVLLLLFLLVMKHEIMKVVLCGSSVFNYYDTVPMAITHSKHGRMAPSCGLKLILLLVVLKF